MRCGWQAQGRGSEATSCLLWTGLGPSPEGAWYNLQALCA